MVAVMFLFAGLLLLSSCKTKEEVGRHRSSRRCNTCTKWSYVPLENYNKTILLTNEA